MSECPPRNMDAAEAAQIATCCLLLAHEQRVDVAAWLAEVAATAAMLTGGPEGLLTHQPDSRDAAHLRCLIQSTVALDDPVAADWTGYYPSDG